VAPGALALLVVFLGCGGGQSAADLDGAPGDDGAAHDADPGDGTTPDAGSSFPPGDLAGLALWLDADDDETITLAPEGRVGVWNDKSGRGNHAYQGSDRLMPVRLEGRQAGRATLGFDGSYLTTSELIQLRAARAGYTVIAVAANTVADGVEGDEGRGGILIGNFGLPEPNVGIELHRDRELRHWWDRRDGLGQPADGNRGDAFLGEPRPAQGSHAILLFYLDADRGVVGGGIDGVRAAEQPDDGFAYEVRRPLRIGADYRETNLPVAWKGELAEILVFERMLAQDELDALHAYLAAKWNIPLSGE
jgi:hypothetical protein